MSAPGSRPRIALIIGAGPAGLTAALELLRRTDVRPIVLEASDTVGGISRTVNHRGYRMDLGGHRFFSKSDWVMAWWQQILPRERTAGAGERITYRRQARELPAVEAGAGPEDDRVMLLRPRLSRIYFLRRFFDYPLKFNHRTVTNLGVLRFARICASYARASLFPRRPELSLEDFLVNRFGAELYRTFFKAYTEKVWGTPCAEISAEWGAQRIKGLSLTRAVLHTVTRLTARRGREPARAAPTSLIERFLYPKLGPGQLWEEVARAVTAGGGDVRLSQCVTGVELEDGRARRVRVRDASTGACTVLEGEFVISTMAVKDLVGAITPPPPEPVRAVAEALPYRDFITVGLRVARMRAGQERSGTRYPPDNWIYVQEPEVRLGRLQIFNNWSPALVPDPAKVWLGLEYFCREGDDLWSMTDPELAAFAARELQTIDLIDAADVEDSVVVRVPKAYPAYFGAYREFATVRRYLDAIPNLFPVGRNGMHRYNNQDHSMLTAKAAVDCIAAASADKRAIWDVNVDDEYHESRRA